MPAERRGFGCSEQNADKTGHCHWGRGWRPGVQGRHPTQVSGCSGLQTPQEALESKFAALKPQNSSPKNSTYTRTCGGRAASCLLPLKHTVPTLRGPQWCCHLQDDRHVADSVQTHVPPSWSTEHPLSTLLAQISPKRTRLLPARLPRCPSAAPPQGLGTRHSCHTASPALPRLAAAFCALRVRLGRRGKHAGPSLLTGGRGEGCGGAGGAGGSAGRCSPAGQWCFVSFCIETTQGCALARPEGPWVKAWPTLEILTSSLLGGAAGSPEPLRAPLERRSTCVCFLLTAQPLRGRRGDS